MDFVDIIIFLSVLIIYTNIVNHVKSPIDGATVDARALPGADLGKLLSSLRPAVHMWPCDLRDTAPLSIDSSPSAVKHSGELRVAKSYRTWAVGPGTVAILPYDKLPSSTITFDPVGLFYRSSCAVSECPFQEIQLEAGECLFIPPQWWWQAKGMTVVEVHSPISRIAQLPSYIQHIVHVYGQRFPNLDRLPKVKLINSTASTACQGKKSNECVQTSEPRLPASDLGSD